MTTKTNKLILRDDTSGYSVTRVPPTNLTANRTITEIDRDGSPAMAQDIQDSKIANSYRFDGSSCWINVPNNANLLFVNSTNDLPFTILVRIRSNAAKAQGIVWKSNGSLDEWGFNFNSLGKLHFTIYDSNQTNYLQKLTNTSLADGKPHALIATYSASATLAGMNMYVDGTLITDVTTNGGSGYTKMGDKTSYLTIGGYSNHLLANAFDGQIYKNTIFNYDISSDLNKLRRYSSGAKLDWEDIGGSMVNKAINSTFESDTIGVIPSWWLTNLGTELVQQAPDYPTPAAHGQKSIKLLASASSGINTPSNAVKNGAYHRISFYVWGTAGDVINILRGDTNAIIATYTVIANNTWEPALFPSVYSYGDTRFKFNKPSATNIMYLDDINIIQLGCVLDLEPENITDSTWIDASPNGLHGQVTGALAQRFTPSYSSRNHIINGGFDFWQRGSSFSASAYIADRWFFGHNMTTVTLASATKLKIGDFVAQLTITNNGGSNQFVYISQSFESSIVRQLAGKQITLSVFAKIGTVTGTKLDLQVVWGTGTDQRIPTGGASFVKSFDLTATLTQYSYTVTIPTNATSLSIYFQPTQHSNGNVITLADAQMNEGPVAAPFERAGGSIGGELALCQRFCQSLANGGSSGNQVRISGYNVNEMYCMWPLVTEMRAKPVLYGTPAENTNWYVTSMTVYVVFTSLTVDAGFTSTRGVGIKVNKTSHGLTDGCISIKSGVIVDAEL